MLKHQLGVERLAVKASNAAQQPQCGLRTYVSF
jgi:hypothetical protein